MNLNLSISRDVKKRFLKQIAGDMIMICFDFFAQSNDVCFLLATFLELVLILTAEINILEEEIVNWSNYKCKVRQKYNQY